MVLRDPTVGVAQLAVVAAVGAAVARVAARRLGDRWPWLAVALAAVAGAIGWLGAPEVRALLSVRGTSGIGEALGANPGGWLAGLAFVRGVAHAQLRPDPARTGSMLWLGVPGLAVAALVGGMIAEPWRSRFLVDAEATVLVFLLAGILALALARLSMIPRGIELDWRRNPAWVTLLVTLVLATAAAAIAASVFAAPVIVAILEAAMTPLLLIGLVAGFDRRAARILLVSVCAAVFLGALILAFQGLARPGGGAATGGIVVPGGSTTAPHALIAIAAVAVVGAIVTVLVLARLWMRTSRPPVDDVTETRVIDRGEVARPARRGRRRLSFGRRPVPTDAVAAYVALLEDLEPLPPVRRAPGETPSQHARRLRDAGLGGLELDLLAADYGLVRFGERRLSQPEERRALARATSLRRRLTLAARALVRDGAKAGASGARSVGAASGVGPEATDEATRPGSSSIGRTS